MIIQTSFRKELIGCLLFILLIAVIVFVAAKSQG
jgi:hypothetical protein